MMDSNELYVELYVNTDARMDTVGTFTSADIDFWKCVRASKKYYDFEIHRGNDVKPYSVEPFVAWLKEEYGIELQMTKDRQINSLYRILDDAKLTLFTLKFTQ